MCDERAEAFADDHIKIGACQGGCLNVCLVVVVANVCAAREAER